MFGKTGDFILSLLIIAITYYIGMGILWSITNALIAIGAPAEISLYYIHLAQWGFIIFLAAAFIIFISRAFKKTYDTGEKFRGFD